MQPVFGVVKAVMSRLIGELEKKNVWGSAQGLDPQRADLWLVDLANAAGRINALDVGFNVTGFTYPQYVQSVSLPENKIKVESFRRDSVPYQMPSWDEPLDVLKIVFWMDTNDQTTSYTYGLLSAWLELVRAGRGLRGSGYSAPTAQLPLILLDDNFSSNYRFDCSMSFLRGSSGGSAEGAPPYSDLECWQKFKIRSMWLAGFKVSDLTYGTNGLVTIDASFYAESVDLVSSP